MLTRTQEGKFIPKTLKQACQWDKWSKVLESYGSWGQIASLRETTKGKKFIVKPKGEDDMSPQMWIAERRAHERISASKDPDTEYFAKYYGYAECSDEEQYLLMEWVGNLSLREALQKVSKECSGDRLETFWIGLLYYLSKITSFLESIGINHRDLHTKNIHIQDQKVKVFDFGLSAGAQRGKDSSWTVTDWGGNFMGEFVTPKFVLGFDLHDFLASLLTREELRKIVPDKIIREWVFPYLKNLSRKEQEELDAFKFDFSPYVKVEFEGKHKVIPSNLKYDWKATSGKVYHEMLRERLA